MRQRGSDGWAGLLIGGRMATAESMPTATETTESVAPASVTTSDVIPLLADEATTDR